MLHPNCAHDTSHTRFGIPCAQIGCPGVAYAVLSGVAVTEHPCTCPGHGRIVSRPVTRPAFRLT